MLGPKPNVVVLYSSSRTGPGDLIASVTSAVGIKPCIPCDQRKQQINQWWFDLVDRLAETFKNG